MTRLNAAFGSALVFAFANAAPAQEPTFGGEDDLAFAAKLWQSLIDARLVGRRSIIAQPYEGSEPHGVILMTLDPTISLDGCEAAVIVKKNYMGEGISIESVATNPALFLDAVTVMFRRESGYDSDNQDWFWAKYRADGTLHANPRGRLLAERVAKNPEDGCIGCHQFAPGDDFVFLHDRFSPLVPVAVERPGWYALSLLYFEKRNTATPQLFWRRPGQGGG